MTASGVNCYLEQVHRVLPRLLALYDTNPISPTRGQGDRFRWAWKLIDFGNGTFQGAAHGLARLLVADLLPDGLAGDAVLRRIDAMFDGTETLRRRDGSLEEALPYESSFCVTALVAYDLLTAIDLLGDRVTRRERYLGVVEPMIGFLHRADERHAVIGNHLATAAAALVRWARVTGSADTRRADALLERVLAAQSGEGWIEEYGGADPGYQTFALYHLAEIHGMRPDAGLNEALRRSIGFLAHFMHPDGSFGGVYGSRNTRLCCPAGFELLAAELPEAAAPARRVRESVGTRRTPTPDVMDASGLVPLFNAYCVAAAVADARDASDATGAAIPCETADAWRREFPEAGLIVDNGPGHYTVVSWKKGGVCYHFEKDAAGAAAAGGAAAADRTRIDAGRVVRSRSGRLYSTQALGGGRLTLDGARVTIDASFSAVRDRLPGPWSMLLLRLAALTFMRTRAIGDLGKRGLVWLLITRRRRIGLANRRVITLGADLTIADEFVGDAAGYRVVEVDGPPFTAVHMASAGYWQMQDDAT